MRRFTPATVMDRGAVGALVEAAAETGYSIAENEVQMNELGVAVAVGRDSHTGGAIHCSVSGTAWTRERLEAEIIPPLLDAANGVG